MDAIPAEILAHIVSFLPPDDLARSQLVCRSWHDLICQESSWRHALESYYDIDNIDMLLGRRLSARSWRVEYISRINLLSQWLHSRSRTLVYKNQIGQLTHVHLFYDDVTRHPPIMLVLSLPNASQSLSFPFKGIAIKVPGTRNTLWRQEHQDISAVVVSPDGRVALWGTLEGQFTAITTGIRNRRKFTPHINSNLRSTLPDIEDSPGETISMARYSHDGGELVQSIAFAEPYPARSVRARPGNNPDSKVSSFYDAKTGGVPHASTDTPMTTAQRYPASRPAKDELLWISVSGNNVIYLWRPLGQTQDPVLLWRQNIPVCHAPSKEKWCLPTASTGRTHSVNDSVRKTALITTESHALVVVGTTSGIAHLWVVPLAQPDRFVHYGISPGDESGGAIDTILFDASDSDGRVGVLIHREGASDFHQLLVTLDGTAQPIRLTTFSTSEPHAITSFAVDFTSLEAISRPTVVPEAALSPVAVPTDLEVGDGENRDPGSIANRLDITIETTNKLYLGGFGFSKRVAVGNSVGQVFMFRWTMDYSSDDGVVNTGVSVIPHSCRIRDANGIKVTSLALNDVLVFVGYVDGLLVVCDAINGLLVRKFNERSVKNRSTQRAFEQAAFDEEADYFEARWKVSHIFPLDEGVVATIGDTILVWQLAPAADKDYKKRPHIGRMSSRVERLQQQMEMRDLYRDSLEQTQAENRCRMARLLEEKKLAELGGALNEEEAFELALALSLGDELDTPVAAYDDAEDEYENLLQDDMVEDLLRIGEFDEDAQRRLDKHFKLVEKELSRMKVYDANRSVSEQGQSSSLSKQLAKQSLSPSASPLMYPVSRSPSASYMRGNYSASPADSDFMPDMSSPTDFPSFGDKKGKGRAFPTQPPTPGPRRGWSEIVKDTSSSASPVFKPIQSLSVTPDNSFWLDVRSPTPLPTGKFPEEPEDDRSYAEDYVDDEAEAIRRAMELETDEEAQLRYVLELSQKEQ